MSKDFPALDEMTTREMLDLVMVYMKLPPDSPLLKDDAEFIAAIQDRLRRSVS